MLVSRQTEATEKIKPVVGKDDYVTTNAVVNCSPEKKREERDRKILNELYSAPGDGNTPTNSQADNNGNYD